MGDLFQKAWFFYGKSESMMMKWGSSMLGKPQMNGMTSDGDRSIFETQGTRVTTDQNGVPNFDRVTQAWPTHQNGVLNVFQAFFWPCYLWNQNMILGRIPPDCCIFAKIWVFWSVFFSVKAYCAHMHTPTTKQNRSLPIPNQCWDCLAQSIYNNHQ